LVSLNFVVFWKYALDKINDVKIYHKAMTQSFA
jgi:hypothetical protein